MEDESAPRREQQAYLLDRILKSPDRRSGQSAILGAKKEREKIGLDDASAQKILTQLVADGHLTERKRGKTVSYTVTEQGVGYRTDLPTIAHEAKSARRTGKPAPVIIDQANDKVKGYRKAYLLWQLFAASDGILSMAQANKMPLVVKQDLEVNPALANQVRAELVSEGLIKEMKEGRSRSYRLTQAGRKMAVALEQHPVMPLPLTGRVLAELKSALATAGAEPGATDQLPKRSLPSDLSETAFAAFEHLRREKYSHTPLVPIWAIRRRIAELYGTDAATHEVLDEKILDLWRKGRVRLIQISEFRNSTDDQRADSIGDDSQTLFYMELANG